MKNSTKSKRLKELLLPLFQEFQEREKKGWTENHTANQTAHTGMFHAQHDDWLRQQQTLSPQNTLHSRHNPPVSRKNSRWMHLARSAWICYADTSEWYSPKGSYLSQTGRFRWKNVRRPLTYSRNLRTESSYARSKIWKVPSIYRLAAKWFSDAQQWNISKIKQFFFRFIRLDSVGKTYVSSWPTKIRSNKIYMH